MQNVFITGCGHPEGIGFSIAKSLAAKNYHVLMTDIESSLSSLEANVQWLKDMGYKADIEVCDVTQKAQVLEVVLRLSKRHGDILNLVNVAGVGAGAETLLGTSDSDWDLSLNVNLLGIRNTCLALLPNMQSNQRGSIVNIASLSGLGAIPGIPACYTASKFAAVGLTKQLALEVAALNIRVNAICPGSIETQMRSTALELLAKSEGITLAQAEQLENETIAMNRAGQPKEVADLVAFLLSDESTYMTGNAIEIAGGMNRGI